MKHPSVWRVCASVLALAAPPASGRTPKAAEPSVAAANARVLTELPFADRQDFEDATRGFISTAPNENNPQQYAFLQQATAPPPSWHARAMISSKGTTAGWRR